MLKLRYSYFKYFFQILLIAGSLVLAGCSSQNSGSGSDGGSASSSNSTSTIALHASNMLSGNTYSGQTTTYDVAFSYACSGGVSGATTLSAASLSLGSASPSSCTFTFNSVSYNGATSSCDTSTTVRSANPGFETPVLITCGTSYILRIVSAGIFNTPTPTTSPNLYIALISNSATAATSSSATIKPVVGTGDQYSCALVEGTTSPKIYCWGSNPFALPLGNFFNSSPIGYLVPTQITTSFTPQTLSVGSELVCTLDPSGNVWCMGTWTASENIWDGNDTFPTISGFTQIAGISNAQLVGTGIASACAVTTTSTKTLQCFGYVDFAPPAATGSYTSSPVTIPASGTFGGDISQIAISNDPEFGAYGAVCVVAGTDKHVECAGNNFGGQLGIGGSDDATYHTPAKVMINSGTALTGVTHLSGQNGTFCATTSSASSSNNLYCWGFVNSSPGVASIDLLAGPNTFGTVIPSLGTYNNATFAGGTDHFPVVDFQQPNYLGFYSYSNVATATASSSSWPGGGDLFAASGSYSSFTSYTVSLSYATLLPFLLDRVSVGGQAICGSYGSKIYCYGANQTDLELGAATTPPSVYQSCSEPTWAAVSAICQTEMGGALWSSYVYGETGTLITSFTENTQTIRGAANMTNTILSYTSSASTVGGYYNLSQDIIGLSSGSALSGCLGNSYGNIDPGHTCVVMDDGAISCFGSNNCSQVGNGQAFGQSGDFSTTFMVTSPTPVLYPTSSAGTYAASYPNAVAY